MLAHDTATVEVIDLRTPNDDLVVQEPIDVRLSISALFPKRNVSEPDSPLMANTPGQCSDTRRTLACNSVSIHC